ncbi:MAG TPA: DUF1552 domain-containing protein, partial [Polyangia bacterium]|nr:DUF1552 domain-containing protein [Polyangia bacterium]
FLRGLGGVTVGLPFLETFAPRKAAAQDATTPKRLVIFFNSNGVNMEKWFPTTPYGALSSASLTGTGLEPLSSYASRILLPRGIHQVPRGFMRDPGGGDDHARGVGCKFTAAPLADTTERYATGVSVDQVIAKAINPGGQAAFNLMVGYRSKDVLGCFSYLADGQQASPFQDPWKAFKDWVGMGGTPGGTVVDKTALRRRSVLDLVKRDFDALKNNKALSAQDRTKLDLHVSSIRDVEMKMTSVGLPACSLPDARTAEIMAINPMTVTRDSEYQKIGGMMMDVMALAMACDHNRVVSLQWGSGASGPIFSWVPPDLNAMYNHHKLSHGSNTDGGEMNTLPADQWKSALFNIDQWYATQLKGLLDRISSYSEPGGNMLDNSAVVYMNDLGDGLGHNWMDLPVMVIGGCKGYFKQGQYIKMTTGSGTANDKDAPSNQLCTTLANAMGVPMSNFGSAPTGKPGEFTQLKA